MLWFWEGLNTKCDVRFDDVCVDKIVPSDMKFIDIVGEKKHERKRRSRKRAQNKSNSASKYCMKHEGANISFKQMERIKNDTQKKRRAYKLNYRDIKITKTSWYKSITHY